MSPFERLKRLPVWAFPAAFTSGFALLMFITSNSSVFSPLRSGDLYGNYSAVFRHFECGDKIFNHFGYPNGMGLSYFPTSDWIFTIPANVISCVANNQFIGINLIWLASFPLTAVAASWTFSLVKVNKFINVTFAIAISLIPYHWMRLSHVFLATMFSMILGIGLVFFVKKKALLAIPETDTSRDIAFRKTILIAILISVLIGGSGLYYAVFTAMFLVIAMVVSAAQKYNAKHFFLSITSISAIFLTLLVSYIPTIIHKRVNPLSYDPTIRNAGESFLYSMNLDRVVMLSPNTGLPMPEFLRNKLIEIESITNSFNIPSFEEGGWFSNVIVFFCWISLPILLLVFIRMVQRPNFEKVNPTEKSDLQTCALLLVSSLLFAIPWGINFLFAVIVSPQIRAWGRLEPAVQFLVLMMVAILLTVLSKETRLNIPAVLIMSVALLILVVDVAKSATNFLRDSSAPLKSVSSFAIDYAEQVNLVEPSECGILQIPYVGYPEAGDKYHFEVAFQNYQKSWSFGQFRGSPSAKVIEDIGNEVDIQERDTLLQMGFCGIHIDLRGYPIELRESTFIGYVTALGEPDAIGFDGNWNYWSFE